MKDAKLRQTVERAGGGWPPRARRGPCGFRCVRAGNYYLRPRRRRYGVSEGPYKKRTMLVLAIVGVLLALPLLAFGIVMVAGGRSGGWSLVWVAVACLGVFAVFGPIMPRSSRRLFA